MATYFTTQQDDTGVEDKSEIQNDVRQNCGSLLQNFLGLGVTSSSEIKNFAGTAGLGIFPASLAAGKPASKNSRSAEDFFKATVSAESRIGFRNMRHAEIANLARRPLRSTINTAVHENASANTSTDGDKDKIVFSLSRAAMIF